MKIEKLNEMTGRPVVIKRINSDLLGTEFQSSKDQPEDPIEGLLVAKVNVDFCDYNHPAITALIPAFETDGRLVSMETGNEVRLNPGDQVLPVLLGTALFFPDGTDVVYTRGWYKGRYMFFFAKKTCSDRTTCPNVRVFGE